MHEIKGSNKYADKVGKPAGSKETLVDDSQGHYGVGQSEKGGSSKPMKNGDHYSSGSKKKKSY